MKEIILAALLGAVLFGALAAFLSPKKQPPAAQRTGAGQIIVTYDSGGGGIGWSPDGGDVTSETLRLALQFFADIGGSSQSYPSKVGSAVLRAVRVGWLDDGSAQRQAILVESQNSDKTSGGGGGSGVVVTFGLTQAGSDKLKELTDHNPNPTRLVHTKRFIPGVGMTVYGDMVEVPLSSSFSIDDGTPVGVGR